MPTSDFSDLSSIEPPSNWSLISRMLGLSWRYRWACTQVVLLQVIVVALGLGPMAIIARYTRSSIATVPWPPSAQMETIAREPATRAPNSFAAWLKIRAPVAANG